MGTITGKFHQNPLKPVGGVAETRLTAEKLLKGLNSGKKSVEHDLDKICASSGHGNNNRKVPSKSLENCRRSCGDKIVSMDRRTEGGTYYYSPLRLTSGDKNCNSYVLLTASGLDKNGYFCPKFV